MSRVVKTLQAVYELTKELDIECTEYYNENKKLHKIVKELKNQNKDNIDNITAEDEMVLSAISSGMKDIITNKTSRKKQ